MRLPERRSDSSALTVNEKKEKKNVDKSDKRPERKEQRKCFKCHKTAPKPAEEAFLCERHDRQDDQWLADSGASAHMTNNKSFFLSYEPFNYPREVQVGNNEIIHAYGDGTINVKMRIHGLWQQNHLKNVWYVPKIGRNLFSIGQTMKKGFLFSANQNGCIFKKDGTVKTVKVRGKRTTKGLFVLDMQVCLPEIDAEVQIASKGLFVLDMQVCLPEIDAEVQIALSKENLQLWHERLCHQNKKHVQKVLKRKGIEIQSEEDFCDGRDVVFKKEMPLKEKLQLLFSKKQKDVDPTSHQTEKVAVNDEPLKEGENDIEVTTSEEAVVEDEGR
ncbi:hypothetical protein QE152_g35632 [Popillia japonica]|uniref:Retrovirus-related Pol polyprotein from transposon TNT 1-94-like beta-barrel domain-containing protein n=1 Tax=Popillia japonica TaxID=7064 RepID=A0AAW1IFX2_POPJA